MKSRIVSMAIMLSMACGLCACGGRVGEKAATITIEGKTYNLSEDFQGVVGSMVQDDLQVATYYFGGLDIYAFNEEGKFNLDEDFDKEEPYITAIERRGGLVPENDELGTFIQKVYLLDENAEFKSKLGFASDSEKEDVEELEGFMKASPIRMKNGDSYVALFVDGEAVDFSQYEDDFEDWKDMLDRKGYMKTYEEFFPKDYYSKTVCRMFNADYLRMCNSYDELVERIGDIGIPIKEEVMLAIAMQEACVLLEDEEVETVTAIKVEFNEDTAAIMEYSEYYYAQDWDDNKLKNY